MRGVSTFSLIVTALLSLHSCGKVSEDDARKMDPHSSRFPRMQVSAEGVQGNWESDCQVEMAENGTYQKISYSLINGREAKKTEIYRDPGCAVNPVWSKTYSGDYDVALDELRQRVQLVDFDERRERIGAGD